LIDKNEFKMLCYDFGHFFSDEELHIAIREVDTQGLGQIGYEDFIKWWSTADRFTQFNLNNEALELRQKASATFQRFDTEKLGYINSADFPAFWTFLQREGLTDKDEAACKEDLDQNSDGNIQFNEYVDWLVRIGTIKIQTFLGAMTPENIGEGQAQKAALKPTMIKLQRDLQAKGNASERPTHYMQYAFTASDARHVGCAAQELVTVMEADTGSGWTSIKSAKGDLGVVPTGYLAPYEPPPAKAPKPVKAVPK